MRRGERQYRLQFRSGRRTQVQHTARMGMHEDMVIAPTMQWHLDWWVENPEAGVAWAIECGAAEASPQPANRDLARIRIMLDPAGHPFCLWT
jgi:hypothetical protein